ncbi:MAG: universal stress protein [Oligoflexia bacterium]|nr:universal stress protein [Oligoflexia bacterium]
MTKHGFKSIIVGLDFSPYSKKVLRQAQTLAQLYNAQLTAVYVSYDPSQMLDVPLAFPTEAIATSKLKQKLNQHYKLNEQTTKSIVTYGVPERELIRIAKKLRDPLLIVGYKGNSPISRFLLGSTAERLALRSPVPVWIQRGNQIVEPKRILVPHDLMRATDSALDTAGRFVNGKAPHVEALFVCQAPLPILYYEGWIENNRKIITNANVAVKKFQKTHPKINLKMIKGEAVSSILKRSNSFDLIVLKPHQHKEFLHSFGKITGKVIREVQVPVLVTR